MTQCKNCEKGYILLGVHEVIISTEMAIDGGLGYDAVGQSYGYEPEYGVCQCCGGYWEDCQECSS